MNKVAAFALRRKNSILSMSEKRFCPPQPLRFWITPAYAGKRRSDWIIRSIYWGHPRVCEEKNFLLLMTSRRSGSPPRVRGKAILRSSLYHLSRITPTCAGKSCRPCHTRWCGLDHPRVCGEKGLSMFWSLNHSGSPPRVRGKVLKELIALLFHGITPAYAGKRLRCRTNCC